MELLVVHCPEYMGEHDLVSIKHSMEKALADGSTTLIIRGDVSLEKITISDAWVCRYCFSENEHTRTCLSCGASRKMIA